MKRRHQPLLLAATLVAASLAGGGALAEGYARGGDGDHHRHGRPGNASVIDTVQRRGLLRVGVGLFEPWVMCDVHGDLIGYEIDVARKIADDVGVRIQFIRTDWYFIVPALIEKAFDVIISGMGITPRRSLLVNFSVPYSEFGTAVIANTMRAGGLAAPRDFDDPNVTFGARSGTVPAQAVLDHFPQAHLRVFDTDGDLLQALVVGDVQAAAVDQVKATRWLDENPDALHRPFEELFNRVPEAIALRKGDIDGLNFLNSWIAHHRTSGWLTERRRYWFETRDWSGEVSDDEQDLETCAASFTVP